MNVFVLCTGRCGSVSFANACSHMTNYTVLHESQKTLLGPDRLDYPDNHIEVDNRLAWLLGRLDEAYGDRAFYVHLVRDREDTARSHNRRWHIRTSIIRAYSHGIMSQQSDDLDVCLDFWDTVNKNIELFLKDKSRTMRFRLENAVEDFRIFWERIDAEGDLSAALRAWTDPGDYAMKKTYEPTGALEKMKRLIVKFPDYLMNA